MFDIVSLFAYHLLGEVISFLNTLKSNLINFIKKNHDKLEQSKLLVRKYLERNFNICHAHGTTKIYQLNYNILYSNENSWDH